jgi:demethylmenaquinone methyltransferase/2-methoxy-6-polyprenyl-1,4-benzoquinol methylase
MEASSRVALVHRFFADTGPSYDWIVNLCTLGCDLWWKRKIMERIPPGSLQILDQACGTGILTFKIARKFPHSHVVGVELREEYLHTALKKNKAQDVKNVQFIIGRAEDVFLHQTFDCITSSYLAKYADFKTLVPNAKRMLRKGGILILHDFTYPCGRFFPRLWALYFTILQKWGSRKYPQWKTVFFELPEFLRQSGWVGELLEALKEHDFPPARVEPLTMGTSTLVTAIKA